MRKFKEGVLGRGSRLGKPSGAEKLFLCFNVVANSFSAIQTCKIWSKSKLIHLTMV